MSLINSLLGPLSPRGSPRLRSPSEASHELPFYSPPRSPNAPPAFPPPPIASSIYVSASPPAPKDRVPDDFLAVQRKARYIEEQLQHLLDSQAEGLMAAGLGGGPPDDQVSNGSSTPTVSSMRRDITSPDRRPARRKVSLTMARRGIYKRVQQMAAVKEEEAYLLDADMAKNKAVLERLGRWESKQRGIEKRIKAIENDQAGSRAQNLQAEAKTLESEIKQTEEKLWAMKARHRKILAELSETENSVEAKLSSYKTSLSLLEADVAKFLARPPSDANHSSRASAFYSLPPKRRTLAMARDHWEEERTRLEENWQEVDMDREALEEGAILWQDVYKRITDFETHLQEEMQGMGRGRTGSRDSPETANSSSKALIAQMDATVLYIETKLKLAEEKNWKLLICCIGAELEAFQQGRTILEKVLSQASPPTLQTDTDSDTSGQELVDLGEHREEQSAEPAARASTFRPQKYFDASDDDPDPELLISHHDTDTD
ncbi:hypothetical protein BU16DRAFT_533902 [Lophium mytilinum]|uniref:Uncharacterized protein n=1 Tax=Lophium mytilinum TaxID=390894 RepID=A0A6A6RCL9_9PEZI|nr:hypothetical protein BU16DRAFT_533902 [Lophium mytilinum]